MNDDDLLYRGMDEDDPLYMGDDRGCRKINKRKNAYKSSKNGCYNQRKCYDWRSHLTNINSLKSSKISLIST